MYCLDQATDSDRIDKPVAPVCKMCYYEQCVYTCNDYKWGNFKAHCNKEYRIGETCGMKFVHHTLALKDKCKVCEKIATKERRLVKQLDDIKRWEKEGNKKSASIEKAWVTVDALEREVLQLRGSRDAKRMTGIGSGRTIVARNCFAVDGQAYSQGGSSYAMA